jgi:hypothetical protein
MDVFSTELGIRLSFVKTSEFRGWGGWTPQTTPSVRHWLTVPHISECWPEDGLTRPKHVATIQYNIHTLLLCFDGKFRTVCVTVIKMHLGSVWKPQLLLNTNTRCHSLAKLVVLTSGSTRWQQLNGSHMPQSVLQPAHLQAGYPACKFSELAISSVSKSL